MPMWHIHHTPGMLTDEDKAGIAGAVTDVYASIMPRFYVNVLFHELPLSSFFVGGLPAENFARFTLVHAAREFEDRAQEERFLKLCTKILAPWIDDRKVHWELHIEQTSPDLWTINGMVPPKANTEAEARWRAENRPSPF